MDELRKTTNALIDTAAETTRKSKTDVKRCMIVWIRGLIADKSIHNEDFTTYARKTINFLSIPKYSISKDCDRWFVEDIVRAAYSHVVGDHTTVMEWISETNNSYDLWEKSSDIESYN